MESQNKNFVLISFWKRIRNIIIILLVILCIFFIFMRYTGIISPVFWDWKKPDVNLISDSETPPFYQNNDQLWVNVNFNEHHSNVKSASIWIQETEEQGSQELQKQDLEEGANTYIFKNLSTGGEEFKTFYIYYHIEWSLWGEEDGELGSYQIEKSANIDVNVTSKTEESMTVTTNKEGEFYTIGEIAPEVNDYYKDKSSAAIYFINEDAISDINKIKNTDIITLITKANKFLNDKNRKEDYKNLSTDVLDVLIYQYQIPDGSNDLTFENIITSNYNPDQKQALNYDDEYLMIGAGVAKRNENSNEEHNSPWFLTFSKPFYANIYGTPEIYASGGFYNGKGDLEINTNVKSNNYDQRGDTYIHYTVYVESENDVSTKQYLTDEFFKIEYENPYYTYTFEDIIHDELCLKLIEGDPDWLTFTYEVEMWYGNSITPIYDSQNPINGGNYQSFKHSNISSNTTTYIKSQKGGNQIIHYDDLTFETLYLISEDSSVYIPYALLITTPGMWINDEGEMTFNDEAIVDVYYSVNNNEKTLILSDAYTQLNQINTYPFTNGKLTTEDDWFHEGDEIEIYFDITIPLYDWFGTATGEEYFYEDVQTYLVPYFNNI